MLLDNTHLLGLEKRNWQTFSNVLQEGQAIGNLVMDGHIAAVALAHGAKIASTDTDFSRFANVSSFNPLKK
jgi:predicted nucleic acid-binding protein